MNTSEFVCYFGSLTALVIAYKLFRIEYLTFPNKMMVFYYSLDSMLGLLEAYFAFKLLRERYGVIKPAQWHLGVLDLTSNREWKYFCILEIKMDHITKVDQKHRFILRIFFPTHFDHRKPKYGSWHCCILWNLGTCLY